MSDTVAEQRHEKSYQIRKNPGPFKGKFAKSCLKNPSQCTYFVQNISSAYESLCS